MQVLSKFDEICTIHDRRLAFCDLNAIRPTPFAMPNLYIISGCNDAGKTTASFTVLPEMLACREFVNADEIARDLSPFRPESVAIQAGKSCFQELKNY